MTETDHDVDHRAVRVSVRVSERVFVRKVRLTYRLTGRVSNVALGHIMEYRQQISKTSCRGIIFPSSTALSSPCAVASLAFVMYKELQTLSRTRCDK